MRDCQIEGEEETLFFKDGMRQKVKPGVSNGDFGSLNKRHLAIRISLLPISSRDQNVLFRVSVNDSKMSPGNSEPYCRPPALPTPQVSSHY